MQARKNERAYGFIAPVDLAGNKSAVAEHLGPRKNFRFYIGDAPFPIRGTCVFLCEDLPVYDPYAIYYVNVKEELQIRRARKTGLPERECFVRSIEKPKYTQNIAASFAVHVLGQATFAPSAVCDWTALAVRFKDCISAHFGKTTLLWPQKMAAVVTRLNIEATTTTDELLAFMEEFVADPVRTAFLSGKLKLAWTRVRAVIGEENRTYTFANSNHPMDKTPIMLAARAVQTHILPYLEEGGHTLVPNAVLSAWCDKRWIFGDSGAFLQHVGAVVMDDELGLVLKSACDTSFSIACALASIHRKFKKSEDRHFLKHVRERCDESQKLAVATAFEQPVSIVTGGPGSGKSSYVLVSIVNALLARDESFSIVTPTGIAATHVASCLRECGVRDFAVRTIAMHRLQITYTKEGRGRARYAALIVDEFSMVPEPELDALLRVHGRHISRLILVGDVNQIEPIEPGCPMKDFIAGGVPITRLANEYRVDEASALINANARRILAGDPNLETKDGVFEIHWIENQRGRANGKADRLDYISHIRDSWLKPRIIEATELLKTKRKRRRVDDEPDPIDWTKTRILAHTRDEVRHLNAAAAHLEKPETAPRKLSAADALYPGRRIIFVKNHYQDVFTPYNEPIERSTKHHLQKGVRMKELAMDKAGNVYLRTRELAYSNGQTDFVAAVYDAPLKSGAKARGIKLVMRDGSCGAPSWRAAANALGEHRALTKASILVPLNSNTHHRILLTSGRRVIDITAQPHVRGGNCCTGHKAQGTETDAGVIPLGDPLSTYSRSLFYTEVTRFKKRVDIFACVDADGGKTAIRRIVCDNESPPRMTFLAELLKINWEVIAGSPGVSTHRFSGVLRKMTECDVSAWQAQCEKDLEEAVWDKKQAAEQAVAEEQEDAAPLPAFVVDEDCYFRDDLEVKAT